MFFSTNRVGKAFVLAEEPRDQKIGNLLDDSFSLKVTKQQKSDPLWSNQVFIVSKLTLDEPVQPLYFENIDFVLHKMLVLGLKNSNVEDKSRIECALSLARVEKSQDQEGLLTLDDFLAIEAKGYMSFTGKSCLFAVLDKKQAFLEEKDKLEKIKNDKNYEKIYSFLYRFALSIEAYEEMRIFFDVCEIWSKTVSGKIDLDQQITVFYSIWYDGLIKYPKFLDDGERSGSLLPFCCVDGLKNKTKAFMLVALGEIRGKLEKVTSLLSFLDVSEMNCMYNVYHAIAKCQTPSQLNFVHDVVQYFENFKRCRMYEEDASGLSVVEQSLKQDPPYCLDESLKSITFFCERPKNIIYFIAQKKIDILCCHGNLDDVIVGFLQNFVLLLSENCLDVFVVCLYRFISRNKDLANLVDLRKQVSFFIDLFEKLQEEYEYLQKEIIGSHVRCF